MIGKLTIGEVIWGICYSIFLGVFVLPDFLPRNDYYKFIYLPVIAFVMVIFYMLKTFELARTSKIISQIMTLGVFINSVLFVYLIIVPPSYIKSEFDYNQHLGFGSMLFIFLILPLNYFLWIYFLARVRKRFK